MTRSGCSVFKVEGKIDAMVSKALETELLTRLDEAPSVLIIDFATCDYMSSAGLRAILITAKSAKQHNKRVVICGMNSIVGNIFKVSGFDRILTVETDLAAAQAEHC
jgi:anti-anti-sigma factor